MNTTTAQSIDRTLILKAPLDKVWNAVATPEGFAGWFLAKVEGEWKQGNSVVLNWPSGSKNEIVLSRIEPKEVFAYQWHPGDSYLVADLPVEELTTVTMRLREIPEGTELALTETGFENIPEERRLKVLGLNTEGWDEELENIRKYVEA